MNVESFPILCGSVAGTASKLGVALHDAGYQALGLDFKYIAFGTDDIGLAVEGFRKLGFQGFGVSMPHKQSVMKHVDDVSDDVKKIGACNTVVCDNGRLVAHNTDWRGALDALKEAGANVGGTAAIVGSGGVARAIAYALSASGANVYICSRNKSEGREIVKRFNLKGWKPIEKQGETGADLVVNATPLATTSETPVRLNDYEHAKSLLDVVFSPLETELVKEAKKRSLAVAPGWRMLLHQALHQFRLYTGEEPPAEEMGKVLERAFSE